MTFRLPPETDPQDWLWIGFPHNADEWPGVLAPAQEQMAAFANAVAESGQQVRLIVRDETNAARAASLVTSSVTIRQRTYGDIWLRDTGPLVLRNAGGQRVAQLYGFNGWGGKYLMPGDTSIGTTLAGDAGLEKRRSSMIFEGGAIDVDGAGMAVTTRQCLLNPNRNPGMTRDQITAELAETLGFERLIWLDNGLLNDHTDGHVDNLARFVAPGLLAVPQATGANDPNAGIYEDAARRAEAAGLTVTRVPSPGRIEWDGMIQPASYMNFCITSHLVVVPIYGSPHDAAGVEAIAALFPDRRTIGLMADAVLKGGGSFHCASQQMPK